MKALGDRCLGQRKRWERGCWGSSTCTGVGSESVICRRYEQHNPVEGTLSLSICHPLPTPLSSETPAQLVGPVMGWYMSCALGDCLTARSEGSSPPGKLWFSIVHTSVHE